MKKTLINNIENALEELNDKVNGDIQETVDSEESHSENDQEKS